MAILASAMWTLSGRSSHTPSEWVGAVPPTNPASADLLPPDGQLIGRLQAMVCVLLCHWRHATLELARWTVLESVSSSLFIT